MIRFLKSQIRKCILRRLKLSSNVQFGRTSFAQEGEDLVLWRLLDRDRSVATYVEVGCNHPFRMSNTAFLYEKGWSGIVIDPNSDFQAVYSSLRPRDTFVNCGVGAHESELTYFRFEESLFNTFDLDRAEHLLANNWKLESRSTVPIRKLKSILSEYWPEGKSIRFLSVDCEGFDDQVIKSHDFHLYPVEFICIETEITELSLDALKPLIQQMSDRQFRPISKLWKSMIFVHESVLERLNLGR